MSAMARNEQDNPTEERYFDGLDAEPEDVRSSLGQATQIPEEESRYMSLKNFIFKEDMSDLLKSLNIHEITSKLEKPKPPPVAPRKSKLALQSSIYRRQKRHGKENKEELNMLVVQNLDVNKVAFIKWSAIYKDKITNHLKDLMASIYWENVEEDRVTVFEVKGGLSPSSQKNVQNWRKETESAIYDFFMDIMVQKITLKTTTRNEAKIQDIMSGIQVPDDDTVQVFHSDELPGIILVGSVISVPKMVDEILSLVKTIEYKIECRSPTQKTSLDKIATWKLKYLQAIGIEKILADRYHGLSIQVDLNKKCIEFSGSGIDVTKARVDITDLLKEVECQKSEDISKYQLHAYSKKGFHDHIQEMLVGRQVKAAFEVVSDGIQVYGKSQNVREEAFRIIQESLKLTYINTDELPLGVWQKVIESISKEVTTLFYIDLVDGSSKGVLVCVSRFQDAIMAKLRETRFQEGRLNLERGVFLVLERMSSSDIGDIKSKHKVDVTFDHASYLITVRGLATNIHQAMGDLKTRSDNVDVVYCDIGRPGAMKFLQSLTGNCIVKQAEDEFNCIIQLDQNPAELEYPRLSNDQPFKAAVTIAIGNICDEVVDVIVCSVNSDLDMLAGDVGHALVHTGGSIIKNQLQRQYAQGLKYGDVAVTTGGNLKCKSIFYFCIPNCGERTNITESYQEIVKSCLEYAEVSNYSSIAFPALDCGRKGYPPHLAARAFLDAVKSYEESTDSSIKEIKVVCDVEDNTFSAFDNERKNRIIGTRMAEDAMGKDGPTAEGDDRATPGVEVVITVGELAQTKADVLVNSCNQALDLSKGAVSQSLVKVGGNIIQRECRKLYPRGIQPGKVAVTGGGNLGCKKIYHCCLPSWVNNPHSVEILTQTIDTCLEMAFQSGYETIAFPALGTGVKKYPLDQVATRFKYGVSVFSKQYPLSSLRGITFVLYDKDNDAIKIFNDLFCQDPEFCEKPTSPEQMQNEEFSVGGLRLKIKTNPLLDEKVDAIVVPTDNKISLEDGTGKQLVEVCGRELKKETQKHFKNNVDNIIRKCLRKADKNKIKSLSIPHIGPATDSGTEIFLSAIVKSLNEYKTTLRELKEINVLLTTPEELKTCVSKFKDEFHMLRRYVTCHDVKQWSGAMTTLHRTESERRTHLGLEGPQMRMFSTDRQKILQCKNKITSILNENLTSVHMVEPAIKILIPQDIDRIKTLCAELDVMVNIYLNNERVEFQGMKADALMAYNKTKEIIRNVEYMNQRKKKAVNLSSTVQWYYFDTDGQKLLFPSMCNLYIEEEYQRGQTVLTIHYSRVQVTLDLRNFYMDASPTQRLKLERILSTVWRI